MKILKRSRKASDVVNCNRNRLKIAYRPIKEIGKKTYDSVQRQKRFTEVKFLD